MRVHSIVFAVVIAATAAPAFAQPTPGSEPRTPGPSTAQAPAAPPRTASAPAPPRREGQPVNVRIEFTLTDQRDGAAPVKRTLTLIVGDERTGYIRTQSSAYRMSEIPLNVDASPSLLSDGKVRLGFNLQYDWPAPIEAGKEIPVGTVTKTTLHDSMTVILESGKPMVVAQSADPIGDRQVMVEVKATILR